MRFYRLTASAISFVAYASGVVGLLPQTALAGAASNTESSATALDEITVTAQKRTENLQDVPLAISAINAKQIEERFGREISDLAGMAPNVIIDPLYGASAATVSIRGLQLDDGEKSFDPAVAIYLDGMYLATTTGALLNIFDAKSVEVLRGPQGTLFGRNTIGGLIQIRRNEPTGEFGGKLIANYGSYDRADFNAMVNLPSFFDNKISTKFSITSYNGGGYFYNVTRNRREGNDDLLMYSTAVKFEPNSDAKIVVNYDHIEDNSPTRPVTSLTAPGELFCNGELTAGCGQPVTNSSYALHPTTAIKQPQFSRTDSIIANGSLTLAPGHELVTVLGYRDVHEDSLEKFDGNEANLFYTVRPQISNQTSAELRYQGDLGRAKLVAGSYFFRSFYHIQQQTFFFGNEVPGYETYQTDKNYAGFAQLDWEFVDSWTLTLGGRYSSEDKNMCAGSATGLPGDRVLQTAFGDCSPSVKASALYTPIAVNTVTGQTYDQTGKASFSSFTPKATITYKFDNDLTHGIAYLNFSKGDRSGGFNGRASSAFSMGPYQPEKVTNYEAGIRTEWMNRRIQANLTAFNLRYRNKQEAVVLPDPVEVTVTVVENAAAATIRGIEGEFKVLPIQGLTVGLNFGYLDAFYTGYTALGFNVDPATKTEQPYVTVNKNNFQVNRAPKFSFDLNGNYVQNLGPKAQLVYNIDYAWKDKYYIAENSVSFSSPNPGLVNSFGLLNASLSYQMPTWQVSLWGKNLTDARYFQHVLDVGTTYGATPTNSNPVPIAGLFNYGTIAPPLTFGIEAQYKF